MIAVLHEVDFPLVAAPHAAFEFFAPADLDLPREQHFSEFALVMFLELQFEQRLLRRRQFDLLAQRWERSGATETECEAKAEHLTAGVAVTAAGHWQSPYLEFGDTENCAANCPHETLMFVKVRFANMRA